MTQNEAKEIIRRLKDVYPDSNLNKYPEFLKEYFAYLLKINHAKAFEIIDTLKLKHKYLPTIAEFNEGYTAGQNNLSKNLVVPYGFWCGICENMGFVNYKKRENNVEYVFTAYCSCELGNHYQYDTSKAKTISINEILSFDEIDSMRNRQKPRNDENIKRLIENTRKQLKEGFNITFEYTEDCPF